MANTCRNPAFPRRTLGPDRHAGAGRRRSAHAYHVFYQKAGDGPATQVNHSAIIYLMEPERRLRLRTRSAEQQSPDADRPARSRPPCAGLHALNRPLARDANALGSLTQAEA